MLGYSRLLAGSDHYTSIGVMGLQEPLRELPKSDGEGPYKAEGVAKESVPEDP